MRHLLSLVLVAAFALQVRPAFAVSRATAGAFVGDVEGPLSDGNEGGYSAFGFKSNDSPEFGSGDASATTIGSAITVKGNFSSQDMFTWTAGGNGSFTSNDIANIIDANHHAGDQYFLRFNVNMNWSVSGNAGGFSFAVGNMSSDWSLVGGAGQNDLEIPMGAGGFKEKTVTMPLENVTTTPNVPNSYTGTFPISFGVSASSSAKGGAGSVRASMRTTKPVVVKHPAGGGPEVTLNPQDLVIISESSEGDTFGGGLPAVSADFDLDGEVNGNDLLIWQRNFPTVHGALQTDGNATMGQDGAVDALDLAAWRAQFGVQPMAVSVPEPSMTLLIATGLLSIAMRRCFSR